MIAVACTQRKLVCGLSARERGDLLRLLPQPAPFCRGFPDYALEYGGEMGVCFKADG